MPHERHSKNLFLHHQWFQDMNCRNSPFFFFFLTNALSLSRPGHHGLTRRAAIMDSRAPPLAPKVVRATSHITTATTRRGKTCETLHRKTFADRGDLAPAPLSLSALTDSPVPFCCQTSAVSVRKAGIVLERGV